MDSQLAFANALAFASIADKAFAQLCALTMCQHPSHDEAAVDVYDDVKVKPTAPQWPWYFADIPSPNLFWRTCNQTGNAVNRVAPPIAAFANFLFLIENAVHRTFGTDIDRFLQKLCVHLRHSKVCKTQLMQIIDYTLSLFLFKFAARMTRPMNRVSRIDVSVVGGWSNAQRRTRLANGGLRCYGRNQRDQLVSFRSGRAMPSISDTFFWSETNSSAFSARERSFAISASSE